MAHLHELPDITVEPYKSLWFRALVRASKRLQRTPTTEEIVEVYAKLLPMFAEADGSLNLEKKVFVLPNLPYAYPEAPGLILRPLLPQDAEIIAPLMVYPELETSRRVATIRAADPFTQTLAWEYKRRLVQTESLRWKPDGSVEIGMAVHCMPRTAEFWREIEKPVFERLQSMGVTTMSTLTLNKLLPYWEPILHEFYHAIPGRVSPLTTHFTYPLDVSVFKGWPNRKTVPGWSWSHDAAGVVMREMSMNEYQTIEKELADSWGGETHPRLPLVRETLDEQWNLDRASILVAYVGDRLVGVFSVRSRRQKGEAHLAALAKDGDPVTSLLWRVIYRGVCEWAYAVGYTTLITLVPKAIEDSKLQQNLLRHTRAKPTKRRKIGKLDAMEFVRDLTAIHAEPQDSWDDYSNA